MPVYVYRNLTTNETFELEQRITEAALTEHPETGDPVKRLIQPVGIAFKGSGFYVNDSRNNASKSGMKADAGKDGAKTETKSEAASETKTKSEASTPDASKSAKNTDKAS